MQKLLLVCLLAMLSIAGYAEEAKKVAILEVVDKEGKLAYSQKLMLRSNLARAITNTEGFEAFDRSDIDEIFKEHNFQRTGNVSAKQIKKLGEMTGAAYILVLEGAVAEDNKIFVTAKILNVETTKVDRTDNALIGNCHRTTPLDLLLEERNNRTIGSEHITETSGDELRIVCGMFTLFPILHGFQLQFAVKTLYIDFAYTLAATHYIRRVNGFVS